jgi:hypothetical protein
MDVFEQMIICSTTGTRCGRRWSPKSILLRSIARVQKSFSSFIAALLSGPADVWLVIEASGREWGLHSLTLPSITPSQGGFQDISSALSSYWSLLRIDTTSVALRTAKGRPVPSSPGNPQRSFTFIRQRRVDTSTRTLLRHLFDVEIISRFSNFRRSESSSIPSGDCEGILALAAAAASGRTFRIA